MVNEKSRHLKVSFFIRYCVLFALGHSKIEAKHDRKRLQKNR